MLIVVLLGLLAAFLFAASASMQQRAARRMVARRPDEPTTPDPDPPAAEATAPHHPHAAEATAPGPDPPAAEATAPGPDPHAAEATAPHPDPHGAEPTAPGRPPRAAGPATPGREAGRAGPVVPGQGRPALEPARPGQRARRLRWPTVPRTVGALVRAVPLLAFFRRLIRTPLWFAGWLTNLAGFVVQGIALHFGSVALVQPLLATQLLFTLPFAALNQPPGPAPAVLRPGGRGWPPRRDWLAAGSVVAGVTVFLAVRGTAPLAGNPDRPKVILASLSAIVVVGLLVAAASGRRAPVHATLLAVAAGLCFAMSAVFMKLTGLDLVQRGVAGTAVDWPGYALAASALCGLVLGQEALASGSLAAAVSAMTITNPLASYLVGVLAFHVVPPDGLGPLAALAGAGALLVLGTVGLAHSPMVRRELAQGEAYDTGATQAAVIRYLPAR